MPLMRSNVGTIVDVSPDELAQVTALGYVPATEDEIAQKARQDEYGTVPQQIATGLEAAGEAATFGASDYAERALGVSPEGIKAREEVNPVAHGVGTAVGIAAPALLGDELGVAGALKGAAPEAASALETLARAAPTNLVGRAGEGVTAGVRALIPEGEGVAAKIAREAVAHGAGSAVEGAAYGAGQVVHEEALGDPNLTAESALSEVGMSALLGGALGGAVGTVSGAGKSIVEALAGSAEDGAFSKKLSGWLEDFEARENRKAAGALGSEAKKNVRNLGIEGERAASLEMRDMGILRDVTDTPQVVYDRANALREDVGPKIRAMTEDADRIVAEQEAAAQAAGKESPAARNALDESMNGAVERTMEKPVVKDLLDNPGLKAAADRFKALTDEFKAKYDANPTLANLWRIRGQIDDLIPYGKEPIERGYARALRSFRRELSTEIEDGVSRVADSPEWKAQLADQWKTLNRQYQVASVALDYAKAGIRRAESNNGIPLSTILGSGIGSILGGAPGAIATGAASFAAKRYGASILGATARAARNVLEGTATPARIAVLAALERNNISVASKINAAASTLVRAGPLAARVARGEVLAGVAKSAAQSQEQAEKKHAKTAQAIRLQAQNPSAMLASVQRFVDPLQPHAPQTSNSLAQLSSRAVTFLASKLPVDQQGGPLAPAPVPSRAEIAKFNRYYDAVENPTSLLKNAAAGTLTPEAVEAVETVYPSLMKHMRQSVIEALAAHPKPPYQQRLAISLLMGSDMDGTQSQESIAAAQAAFAGAPKPSQQPPKMRAGSKITLSERAAPGTPAGPL